jgi:hypothetical protein
VQTLLVPVHIEPVQHACPIAPQLAHLLSAPHSWPVPQPEQVTLTPQLSATVPHLPEQVMPVSWLAQLQTLLALQVCGAVHSAFEQQLPVLGMHTDPHCR